MNDLPPRFYKVIILILVIILALVLPKAVERMLDKLTDPIPVFDDEDRRLHA